MIKRHPSRLAGALLLGTPPNLSYVNLPVAARIISAPLLGYLVWRSLTDAMIRRSLAQTFAPGFDANPAVCAPFIEDLRRMTHNSYVAARAAVEGYRKERDLTARVAGRPVPILVAFGDQDQWVDPSALEAWKPMAETRVFRGVGHTPISKTLAPLPNSYLTSPDGSARMPHSNCSYELGLGLTGTAPHADHQKAKSATML